MLARAVMKIRAPGCVRGLSSSGSTIVSSWNEFDPLEEVIVGIADGSATPPDEPSHRAKIWHLPNTFAAAGEPRWPSKIAAAAAEVSDSRVTVL
jgi:hypothetical protein